MTYVIGFVSQKGGVGKSTLARLVALELIKAGMSAKIADLDTGQSTSYHWQTRRNQAGIEPYVPVQQYPKPERALEEAKDFDVLLLDGLPHADAMTAQIAKLSDLVVIPTGVTVDDRMPGKTLAQELVRKKGILGTKIAFALCRVPGRAEGILSEAYFDLADAGFQVLPGALREQASYASASNKGKALSECTHSELGKEAEKVAQGIVDMLAQDQSPTTDAQEAVA